jgi:hypothetical protein
MQGARVQPDPETLRYQRHRPEATARWRHELTAVGQRFRRVAPPTPAELEALLVTIVTRVARQLERRGLVVRDAENVDCSYDSS